MKIIAFLNQKGGVGKTTLALHVATYIQMMGNEVLLVDTDPQGSLRDWHVISNSKIPVIAIDKPTLAKDIEKIALGKFKYVIIDGVPQLEDMAISAIKCADLVVIPVQASPLDLWASDDLVELIKVRQELADGKPKAVFCLNRKVSNVNLNSAIFERLKEHGIDILNTSISQRIVYAKSLAEGKTIFDLKNQDAINEIQNLTNEIKSYV